MQINILQSDIDSGLPFRRRECALAIAVRRAFHDGSDRIPYVEVTQATILVRDGKREFMFPIPETVQAFVANFDRNKHLVEPFSFELPI